MPQSLLRLVQECAEYIPEERVLELPRGLRGLYVLVGESAADYDSIVV